MTSKGRPRETRPVRVAIIDSGWSRYVPDHRVLPGLSLIDVGESGPQRRSEVDHDVHGHGTMCTRAVLEIAPAAVVIPIRVFGRNLETSIERIVAALAASRQENADVVSMSFSSTLADAIVPLYRACEECIEHGQLLVAAADASSGAGYPATFSNVIGVKAGSFAAPIEIGASDDEAIEYLAPGAPPGARLSRRLQGSNSVAAARVAGALACFRAMRRGGGMYEARAWLTERAVPVGTGASPTPVIV